MNSTKVLILGHSIVRRFHHFLIDDEDLRYVEDLGINSHAIRYKGTGGRTIDGILRHDVPFIKRFQPDHIILMVGGNDVRQLYSPEELACKLLAVVSVLHKRCSVSQIHVCKLLPRFRQSFDYNQFVDAANALIKKEITNLDYASFWEHNGLFPSPASDKYCDHKFLADGVHLNKQGYVHLYRSLRGLILSRAR